jgi:hypothetical protein
MSMERDALAREIDEELRRERLQKLWAQYGTYIVAAVLTMVLGIGGYNWWQSRKIAASERAGQQFEQALELTTAGSVEEARKVLQSIGSASGGGYPTLAQLTLAGQAVKEGKTDAAIAAYDAAAARASDPLIKDFARLQSTALKIESSDFTEVQNRLNDLIGDKSPWRYLAREVVGVSAIRSGKLDEARNLLAPLSADARAPAAVRERAGALMNLVVAAEQERSAPGKVELEPTESAAAPESPKSTPPPRGAVTPKGGAPKGK